MKQYNLSVNGQMLTYEGSVDKQPSHTVGYAFCHFNIVGDEWDGTVKKAVFENRSSGDTLVVTLDSNNECEIPHEILEDSGQILVNLVGTILDSDVVDYRITTGQVKLDREILVPIDGDNSVEPTSAEWEQFIIPYGSPLAEAETLAEGSDATADVSIEGGHTTFSFGIPRGNTGERGSDGEDGFSPSATVVKSGNKSTITIVDKDGTTVAEVIDGTDGEDGNGIASTVLNADYTLTITFTDGTSYTTPPIRGQQGIQGIQGIQGETGATGNGIASTVLNDDYTLTITFTDGTSYTTPSIRGEQGEVTEEELTEALSVKVDKAPGKGLSTNDFTNANKAFVDNFTIVNDEICMEV